MVKIISRKSLGIQTVYDIGVKQDHNFVLSQGHIASNCFNKSHSMAYAYVTYQTAYLKANYPTEYMAALLTANSGDQEKIQKYIENCKKTNIKVEGPDINRSEMTFTPLKNHILFGFSAIKNVGENPILAILEARKNGGEFKSLADLCERVNLQNINRRTLESLIKCGACDSLEPQRNRSQLIHDLDGVMKWATDRKKDQESGQGNLFDLLGIGTENPETKDSYESVPKHPPVPDFNLQEKLQLEKELLGFYVSEHPLKAVLRNKPVSGTITLDQVSQQKTKTVKLVAMISGIKPVTTKKGDRMAIVQLEDLTGQIEAVIFPKTYTEVKDLVQENAMLLIQGKIDKRDDSLQLIVEEMTSMDQIKSVISSPIILVELTLDDLTDLDRLNRLKALLQEQSDHQENSPISVGAKILEHDENSPHSSSEKFVRFGEKFWVQNSQTTIEALKNGGFEVELFSPN